MLVLLARLVKGGAPQGPGKAGSGKDPFAYGGSVADTFGEAVPGPLASQVAALSLLGEDLRRRLYFFIREAPGPVTRQQAAGALGISRKLAAFHLDKLVSAGLLARAPAPHEGHRKVGRRPAVYEPTDREVHITIPPRDHQLLSEILLEAMTESGPRNDAVATARRIARGRGAELGKRQRASLRGRLGMERARAAMLMALGASGYEPVDAGVDGIRLTNCPFQPLTEQFRELVCGLNLEQLRGLAEGLGSSGLHAEQHQEPGACCVRIRLT